MSMDLTGITNQNEYYTNHYFSSIFEENASETISAWRTEAKESEEIRTPWALLRDVARQYYPIHDRFLRSKFDTQTLVNIRTLADMYLKALGYPEAKPEWIEIDETLKVPIYLELTKTNGAPALWILLATSDDKEASILEKYCFAADEVAEEGQFSVPTNVLTTIPNEDLVTKILFCQAEPPRFILLIGMNQIALIDRNKWNEKRYLQFELEDIFSRHEESTLQAMAVLLHRNSLCPDDGIVLLDELDASSQKHAAGVSQDLKYALRESIEILGNEVLFDMKTRQGRNLEINPVNAGELTLECLRYMYRMLFVLFIEARPELGYAPIQNLTYKSGYSLDNLRDIADDIRDDVTEVGGGYFLHETLSKLFNLIYSGYPKTEEELLKYSQEESLHDMFVIAPLKAHIFDPDYTKMITKAKLRNSCMLRIIDLMSLTRETGRRNDKRGRISYANLGINQMGSVYEALLSYRGFIAETTLFEVKRAGDSFNELDVGYFVTEDELDQYTEDERVRYEKNDLDGKYKKGQLRKYEKGTFIYRLAGREREKSASYYTPEVLTKCLVKYALKELLEGKTADEILQLTICEPAMGSAAFLNEAITQLAEAYLDKKQKELGEMIPANDRLRELQKVKMFMADRNVYGIDLNPVAVELAEVSLWLNTIYEGGFVPWFGEQLVNGNSLIGARRQVYHKNQLVATTKGLRWYENAPERIPFVRLDASGRNIARSRYQVYHFLTGDRGMCRYNDKVIKSLEPKNIKLMKAWNKQFTKPYSEDDFKRLIDLSKTVDVLWREQIKARQLLVKETSDSLDVYGYKDNHHARHKTIREKDKFLKGIYKSERAKNAGAYARLKFAMDYWCALWFWPIDQAEMLPSRDEFINDMDLILNGVMETASFEEKQLSLIDMGEDDTTTIKSVNLGQLCALFPRMALVRDIANQNHFMHWELEFADLFAKKGGFDLVIGNPPWIKVEWNEQGVLSDRHPMFAVKKLSATQTTHHRFEALSNEVTRRNYLNEFEMQSGQQAFLNAIQNYDELRGQQTNLFKCFLPQAWRFGSKDGVSAFIHPDGVYDDPKGDALRIMLYPRLRRHYQFVNEKLLFAEVGHPTVFSLNVYGSPRSLKNSCFHSISNLFDHSAIDQCYEEAVGEAEGIKDENGEWSVKGHPDRVLKYGEKELSILAALSDDDANPYTAKLLALQTKELLETTQRIADYPSVLRNVDIYMSEMWHETYAQNDGTIRRNTKFPNEKNEMICSGPHIAVGNPVFKTPRAICEEKGDYDVVDLTAITDNYMARTNYTIDVDLEEYIRRDADVWGVKYHSLPRLVSRKMLNLKQERTFNVAIIPEGYGHINGLVGVAFSDFRDLLIAGSSWASIPLDFYVKVMGKANFNFAAASGFPVLNSKYDSAIITRGIMLNAVTQNYALVYEKSLKYMEKGILWAKEDIRLPKIELPDKWERNVALRTDYERRQALVEIDVLTAMAIGMSLKQLKSIYRLQFAVSKQYEADTWYDANGRIVFTVNRSLTGVGFSRKEWENGIKGAPAGQKFYRTITDDTMPGGPVERTIEYVAPFDRCDREKDYEIAWKFFEEKYGDRL